jgi:hypothetical protein
VKGGNKSGPKDNLTPALKGEKTIKTYKNGNGISSENFNSRGGKNSTETYGGYNENCKGSQSNCGSIGGRDVNKRKLRNQGDNGSTKSCGGGYCC